ncbi:MAG: hypothetical protein C0602_12860 [Denitrovibrio sp.]|nr:MAG: hypothetical protein C0602_12860 [Denitrovibrio sp.]
MIAAFFPAQSVAQENIRGIFFENISPHLLGVRLINRRNRVEDHYVFDPNTKVHIDTKLTNLTLSAQLITSSFPIDCCEWTIVDNGETVIIEYLEDKNRCYCKIK